MIDVSRYFKYEDILANEFTLYDMLIHATQQKFNRSDIQLLQSFWPLLYIRDVYAIIMGCTLPHSDPTFSHSHEIDALLLYRFIISSDNS